MNAAGPGWGKGKKTVFFRCAALLAFACITLGVVCLPPWHVRGESVFLPSGIGGGGGLYSPVISPYDERLVIVCCDMGGVYRSEDGGKTWSLISMHQDLSMLHLGPPPVFAGPRKIYWVTGIRRLCLSEDGGHTWKLLPKGPWERYPKMGGKNVVRHFTVFPSAKSGSEEFLVSAEHGVWLGRDHRWRLIADKTGGPVMALQGLLFAAAGDGELMLSRDNGENWRVAAFLPGRIMALAGASEPGGKSLILASVRGKGIYRSEDMGASWQRSTGSYENETQLKIVPEQILAAYALQTEGIKTQQLLKSVDGGKSWEKVFRMPPTGKAKREKDSVDPSWLQTSLYWNYYFTRNGFAVSRTNPDFCLVTTSGEIYASRDGGESWRQSMAHELEPLGDGTRRWQSVGLEITSCWGYYFNPHEPAREYIAYSDIGFSSSVDRGRSWSWSASGSPWMNTFYDLVFDPDIPGRLYAAASRRHDIPHYLALSATMPGRGVNQGGVVVSDLWGESWKRAYGASDPGALPNHVCTTIALDPDSPSDRRILYAGLFGEDTEAGVYISRDSGKTWRQTATQPGVLPNRHVYRLRIHPYSKKIYCLITGFRGNLPNFFNHEGGGLWASSDQGNSWEHLTAGSMLNRWATALAFDPENENVLYVTAATPQGGTGAGGVYKSSDGGKTWLQVLKDKRMQSLSGGLPYDHTMAVAVHPGNSALVFVGTTNHGLFFSTDAGNTWRWCKDFYFTNAQSIAFDPRDGDRIIVTTFGAGVWSASISRIVSGN